ncbi:MAG: 2-oxoglutarate dehydrogenase complex dihydrolipoyllysine-residue succinyltransferase [Bryobacterales bacterium]
MAVDVKVPTSGESISEVQIGQWRKSEGDRVTEDEVLVEIETDKAAMDLPAPVSGTLIKILKKDGEEAAPGDIIAQIEESGEARDKGKKAAAEEKKTAKEPPKKDPEPDEPERKEPPHKKPPREDPPKDKPPVRQPPDEDKPDEIRVSEKAGSDGAEARVLPAARRLLAEHDLDAGDVDATGPGGRLLKEDVMRHLERHEQEAEKPAAPATRQLADDAAEEREEQIVPMSPLRRVIAKNLVAAQQNAALLTTFNEVDMTEVINLRKHHQEAFQRKYDIKLGFMSFFVKAAVEALKQIPQVNAEVRDTTIVYRNYYDIGIAVGGGRGLVVPILRNAERLGFAEIELAIADFARRAQANKIELSELKGGTFTISNGGIYGSMLSTPIVNAPQSGILGLHAIQDRPVARDGQVVVRPVMYVALTYDHRIVDGREAVTFLKHIKDLIEQPVRMLIEI